MAHRGVSGRNAEGLGTSLGAPLFVLTKSFTGSTTAWTVVADAPFAFRVVGGLVVATATNGGGTVRVDNGSNPITGAMVCATDTYANSFGAASGAGAADIVDDAYHEIAKGGSLKLTTANSAAGIIYVYCCRV